MPAVGVAFGTVGVLVKFIKLERDDSSNNEAID